MIDLDAGAILDASESIDDVGDRLFELVIDSPMGGRQRRNDSHSATSPCRSQVLAHRWRLRC